MDQCGALWEGFNHCFDQEVQIQVIQILLILRQSITQTSLSVKQISLSRYLYPIGISLMARPLLSRPRQVQISLLPLRVMTPIYLQSVAQPPRSRMKGQLVLLHLRQEMIHSTLPVRAEPSTCLRRIRPLVTSVRLPTPTPPYQASASLHLHLLVSRWCMKVMTLQLPLSVDPRSIFKEVAK